MSIFVVNLDDGIPRMKSDISSTHRRSVVLLVLSTQLPVSSHIQILIREGSSMSAKPS